LTDKSLELFFEVDSDCVAIHFVQVLTSHSDHKSDLDVIVGSSHVKVALVSVQVLDLSTFICELLKVYFLNINYCNVALYQLLEEDGKVIVGDKRADQNHLFFDR
jgi:hypothetical protein